MGGLQTIMDQFSSFTMAAEDVAAVAAVTTDYSSSQASEYSNYSLYGTLALVRNAPKLRSVHCLQAKGLNLISYPNFL